MKELSDKLGEVVFWKIAMKPGRPLAYGRLGGAHFFGLPGNPVAVMVTFYEFVQDALRILQGRRAVAPLPTFKVPLAAPIRKLPGRTEFQRGILAQDGAGVWTVRTTGDQGSGILSSMSRANCFIVLSGRDRQRRRRRAGRRAAARGTHLGRTARIDSGADAARNIARGLSQTPRRIAGPAPSKLCFVAATSQQEAWNDDRCGNLSP